MYIQCIQCCVTKQNPFQVISIHLPLQLLFCPQYLNIRIPYLNRIMLNTNMMYWRKMIFICRTKSIALRYFSWRLIYTYIFLIFEFRFIVFRSRFCPVSQNLCKISVHLKRSIVFIPLFLQDLFDKSEYFDTIIFQKSKTSSWLKVSFSKYWQLIITSLFLYNRTYLLQMLQQIKAEIYLNKFRSCFCELTTMEIFIYRSTKWWIKFKLIQESHLPKKLFLLKKEVLSTPMSTVFLWTTRCSTTTWFPSHINIGSK